MPVSAEHLRDAIVALLAEQSSELTPDTVADLVIGLIDTVVALGEPMETVSDVALAWSRPLLLALLDDAVVALRRDPARLARRIAAKTMMAEAAATSGRAMKAARLRNRAARLSAMLERITDDAP